MGKRGGQVEDGLGSTLSEAKKTKEDVKNSQLEDQVGGNIGM